MELYNLTASQTHEQNLPGGLLIDFALGTDFLIDGYNLPAGHYRCGLHTAGIRSVQNKRKQSGLLLSLQPDEDFYIEQVKNANGGFICREAYYYILQLMNPDHSDSQNKVISSLLIRALKKPGGNEVCPIPFTGLQKVFLYLQKIESLPLEDLRKPEKPPLDKKRFQLGCRFLYQNSFKCILQTVRLNKAMKSLLFRSEPVAIIREKAGYHHGPSFRKAIMRRFMISPDSLRFS